MKRILTLILTITIFTYACDDDSNETSRGSDNTLSAAVENYANLVHANYVDAHSGALSLQTTITSFTTDPSEATLEAAKKAWLEARETYGQTEAFRFYGGPIDDEDGPEGQLNAWPLDESHIDYVIFDSNGSDDSAGTNIINDSENFPTIDKALISSQNENGGESNVSSGYHAIEFLLWGQDVSTGAGGGERAFTDYTTADNSDRRATYLSEATALLIDDLNSLINEWATGGTYRTIFTSSDNLDASLESVISALGKLSKGELAGERMYVAYDLKSKEDEHSCFSDNTHRDIVTNALGIQNVYEGTYKSADGTIISGTSFKDVLAEVDAELAAEISTLLATSVSDCELIQAPFDQEFLIEDGRARILNAINSLRDQGDKLAEAATALGFNFDPEDI
ncbi:MAG: peptidase m75, imelysin [Reichenbachiella sp.]